MELTEILKISRRFYCDHCLDEWRRNMPKEIRLDASGEESVQQSNKLGFTRGFAFPSFDVQIATLDQLIDETARKPAARLSDNQQYADEPVLSDTWSRTPNNKVLQRTDDLDVRTQGPYILQFAQAPAQNAWGRTGKQIIELFQARGWRGFTVPEYLVLQRYFCERFGDHRFHEGAEEKNHWLWLIDSADNSACSVTMASSRGINIQACPLGNRDSRRGAVPSFLVASG